MPRQSNSSSFFGGYSSFSHFASVNYPGLVQQNVDSVNISGYDPCTSTGWTGESSSGVRSHIEDGGVVEALIAEHAQLPPPDANTGTIQTAVEEPHSELNGDRTVSSQPVTHWPQISPLAISNAILENLGLNVADEDINGNIQWEDGSRSTLVANGQIFERNTHRRIAPRNEQGFLRSSGSYALSEEENSRYISRSTSMHSIQVPVTVTGDPGQNIINLTNSPGNHSSQNVFSGIQLYAHPDIVPQRNLVQLASEVTQTDDITILQYPDGLLAHGPDFAEEDPDDEEDFDGWEDDEYGDMRLDVDNMSYEELLALGERMGTVSSGLSDEDIFEGVEMYWYKSPSLGPPVKEEICCICQESYQHREELGELVCGHNFHFSCVKQWLGLKNACPICKKAAFEH